MQVYIFATPFSSRRIVSKATFKWICNVWHLSGVEEMLMNNILKCKEYAEHELYETINRVTMELISIKYLFI